MASTLSKVLDVNPNLTKTGEKGAIVKDLKTADASCLKKTEISSTSEVSPEQSTSIGSDKAESYSSNAQ